MATNYDYQNENKRVPAEERAVFPGLIGGTDAFAAVLHGFEVTVDGYVVIPELCPKPII